MASNLSFHHRVDMQIACSSKGLRCSQWSFCGKNMDLNLAFNYSQKSESKPGNRCPMWPKRALQAIQAHHTEGFCSEILVRDAIVPHSLGLLKEENLFRRGFVHRMDGDQPGYGKLKSHSSCREAAPDDSRVMYGPGFICDRQSFTTKNDASLRASLTCRTHMAVNMGIAADFGQMNQMSDKSLFDTSQKPPAPYGWLSLGVCGNALIMRVGSDARCFHQHGLACGQLDFAERMKSCDILYAPADAKTYGLSLTGIGGSSSKVVAQEPVALLQGTTISTKKLRGKNKQKKIGKTATLTRDLFERSSFHLFEFLFCYPFMNPNAVASSLQIPSRESLRELVGILNQAAVGLAGVGVTLLLFVASRMLCINAAFDKHRIASLAMGVGFFSLSFAVKRVSDVVMSLADAYSRSRDFKKQFIVSFQKELQYVALNALPLIVMCLMGAG
eukprot:c14154_g1_i1 orf=270-1601(+)